MLQQDEMEVSKLVDLYYSGPISEENEQKIRDFFMRTYVAKPGEQVRGRYPFARVAQPDQVAFPDHKRRPQEEVNIYFKDYIEKEVAKYKEKLKTGKVERIINDFKPHKRNPNEVLFDIGEEYIINKRGNWANLCILEYQEKLLETIRTNQVVLVKGFTGCGKSTQIPQYIAVDCQNRGQSYNIIVTQPRRVAAKMLATRVAFELNCTVGSLVGYQIGLDRSRDSKITKILYCTTGVLLQRLIMSSNFNFFTHIILDEIHERSADMDMLFLLLKKKMFEENFNARVIMMSATCDVDLFQQYFTFPEYVISNDCFVEVCPAVVEISSSRMGAANVFRQEIFYLDDIVGKIGNLRFNYSENFLKYVDFEEFILNNADEHIIFNKNYPLLHRILHEVTLGILFHGIEIHQFANRIRGSVLIFLPGLAEILELMHILKTSPYAVRYKWKFFILHSTVSLKEQTEVMKMSIDGYRHIILATNIAESSLTVPNVEYVIDYCLCKTLIASRQGYNMTYLALEWSSKSSSDQRAGRTGRTNHGQVFRLIPNHFYQTMHEYEVPEFEKTPLENYVLKAKLIDQNLPPKDVLAYALTPPKLEDIEQSVLTLKRVGAFTVHLKPEDGSDFTYDSENGNLTALGYIMALLPLDIMLSKLVALGLVFDVTYEAIVIAAAHCTTGFFMKNAYDPIYSYKSHLSWSNRSLSDSLAYLKAYRMYKTLESKFNNNSALAQKWCFKNNIEYQRLLELETLISEITNRLEMNLKIDLNIFRRAIYKKSEQELIIKVVIAGAFYPNYFTRDFVNEELIQRYQSAVNTENTVILTGFCRDTVVTALYIPYLKRIFEGCSNKIDFTVDGNVVFMTLDANNHEISIEDEDHPLYLAYSSHINSHQIGQTKGAILKNWSAFHETNVHTSVYLAMAFKKFMKNQITINRYRSTIENFHKKDLLKKIKQIEKANKDEEDENGVQETNIIARVSESSRKYLLPKIANLPTSTLYVGLRITHFLTPHLFYVLYKHSYIEKMLYNINLLSATLLSKSNQTSRSMMGYNNDARPRASTNYDMQLEVGDFVIAPLNIERYNAIAFIARDYDISIHQQGKFKTIMARAEIVKLSHHNYKPLLSLYYVDFGVTDTVPLENIFKLSCKFSFSVEVIMREALTEEELSKIESKQNIYDYLFSIPPLAVRCELVRIKPFSAVEHVGNWMPQVKKFISDYCSQQEYMFTAKVYAYLNDRLYTELYPINRGPRNEDLPGDVIVPFDPDVNDNVSLNELLVQKKYAEFKLETDVCQQMNFRRDMNNFHENYSKEDAILEEFALNFDTDVLNPSEFQFDVDQLEVTKDRQFTHNLIRIRGPLSPLEVKFGGMSHMNSTKNVVVSSYSINSVALEPDVTAKHARLLVAGEINLSEINQNRLTLSNTTYMPSLIDFPAFMCLMFAPYVELRVNKLVSKRAYGLPEEFCGAICGVGYNPATNSSYDPDNDIDIFFDSSINLDDLELINFLRYQISMFFHTKEQHINSQNYDAMKKNSTYSLEFNLFKRQRKCREILFQLLGRTRIKRKWFQEEEAVLFPEYRWNLFGDNRSKYATRRFTFKEFSKEMFETLNLKTSVLSPILIPNLNPNENVLEWEHDVMNNLTNIEEDNFIACMDKDSKFYQCKLCMYCTFSKVELQSHKCSSINTTHKEAAYLFKQYYPIWKKESISMKEFAQEIIQDEKKEEKHDDFNANWGFEMEGSGFDCLDYQIGLVGELGSSANESLVCKDLYDAPVLTSQDQKNMHMHKANSSKNPYSLSTLKRHIDYLIEQGRAYGEQTKSITQLNRSAYESLTEYFDDDEISILNQLNLLTNFHSDK